MKAWYLIVGALLIGQSSCGIFETSKRGKKVRQVDTKLAGSWESDCVSADVLELTKSQRTYIFSAIGDFDKVEHFYGDDTCSDRAITFKLTGTYDALGKNPENQEIKNINLTVNTAKVTPESDSAAEMLNTASLCGSSDWQTGKEVDITGMNCAGLTMHKGDVIFDIYDIRDKKLYTGQKALFLLSSDDADSRPSALDTDIAYEKQ